MTIGDQAASVLRLLEPERAHRLAIKGARGMRFRAPAHSRDPRLAVKVLGLDFPNPIGLAAGLDKDALVPDAMLGLGFGWVEVGTVTPLPQAGNPQPRLFRLPADRALINRLGFNNDGADAVAERLRSAAPKVPLFVNIGKNRDVPLEAAPEAYGACAEKLAPHADVVVINISSPNTPGLRDLQRPEHLERVVSAVAGKKLVKIAPDLDDAQLAEICDVCVRCADGMICTNTTATDRGGLSGEPLMRRSTEVLAKVRERVGANFPLIGVGGVFTADDVRVKMGAGANLVQVYTGFVYEGPMIVKKLLR